MILAAMVSPSCFAGETSQAVKIRVADNPGEKELEPLFVGLSYESSTLLPRSGRYYFDADDAALVQTFRTLGVKSLRLGGNSVDDNRVGVPQENDIDSLFRFARAAGVKVIYSFRLQDGNPAESARLAGYIASHYADALDCFSIGNEPDLYKPKISYEQYLAMWKPHYEAILKVVPNAQFDGPCTDGNIRGDFPLYLARDIAPGGHLAMVSDHRYFFGIGRSAETNVPLTQARFLAVTNHNIYASHYARFPEKLAAAGVPYRMDEMNNCGHGGAKDVSDSYAATLWELDCTHWWANHHILGMNYHTGESVFRDTGYGPVNYSTFVHTEDGSGFTMRPPAYALLAFSQGAHGRPLQVAVESAPEIGLSAYAYKDDDGSVYLTLINLTYGDHAHAADVNIHLPHDSATGVWQRINLQQENGNIGAKSGITLGEGNINHQGKWSGKWITFASGNATNVVAVVAPSSAAILRFTPESKVAQNAFQKSN